MPKVIKLKESELRGLVKKLIKEQYYTTQSPEIKKQGRINGLVNLYNKPGVTNDEIQKYNDEYEITPDEMKSAQTQIAADKKTKETQEQRYRNIVSVRNSVDPKTNIIGSGTYKGKTWNQFRSDYPTPGEKILTTDEINKALDFVKNNPQQPNTQQSTNQQTPSTTKQSTQFSTAPGKIDANGVSERQRNINNVFNSVTKGIIHLPGSQNDGVKWNDWVKMYRITDQEIAAAKKANPNAELTKTLPNTQTQQRPSELNGVPQVELFQDWLDETHPGWAYGHPNGTLNKGGGYGKFGPRTSKAWTQYGNEYKQHLQQGSAKVNDFLKKSRDNFRSEFPGYNPQFNQSATTNPTNQNLAAN